MKQNSIELEVPEFGPSLVGLVEAVALLAGESSDELMGISSCAFSNYVFDPQYNQHEEPPRLYSPYSQLFTNYGPWSSIGYYTGREIREVSSLNAVETLKVVVFEIENGRPIVSMTEALEPMIITGYRISVEERIVETSHGEFEVRDDVLLQGDDEVFRNWLLLVRPGEQQEWAASRNRQRINVLRWAAEHGQNPKEFFQETRENYAPGIFGWERFRELLEGLNDPAAAAFAEKHVRMLAAQRKAAARCLGAWAGEIAAELEADEVATELEQAAEAYDRVAHALATLNTLAEAVDAAIDEERAAIRALGKADVHFPAPFEM